MDRSFHEFEASPNKLEKELPFSSDEHPESPFHLQKKLMIFEIPTFL
jgi:hypothetical protein